MGRCIAAFMVSVDGQIESHERLEVRVFDAQHVSKIGGPIEGGVWSNMVPVVVGPSVNVGSNARESRDEVHGIFIGRVPVFVFMKTFLVPARKDAFSLHAENGQCKLGHGVGFNGKGLEQCKSMLWDIAPVDPLLLKPVDFLIGWDFTNEHEPEQPFRQRLLAIDIFGEFFLKFGNGVATEADSVDGIQGRCFPDHTFYATHSAEYLAQVDLVDFCAGMFAKHGLDFLAEGHGFFMKFFL